MNVKQFLCAGMTGALLVAGLTACAPGAPEVDPSDVAYQTAGVTRDTVLFTVDGTEVTADEYLFWLLQSVASAKQSGYLADDDAWEEELNGVPTAEYLKEDARNTSVLYTTVSNHAAAAGLTVTEEEQAEADAELETLTQRVDSYYGMTLQEYLDQQCISEAAFRKLNQVPYLAREPPDPDGGGGGADRPGRRSGCHGGGGGLLQGQAHPAGLPRRTRTAAPPPTSRRPPSRRRPTSSWPRFGPPQTPWRSLTR